MCFFGAVVVGLQSCASLPVLFLWSVVVGGCSDLFCCFDFDGEELVLRFQVYLQHVDDVLISVSILVVDRTASNILVIICSMMDCMTRKSPGACCFLQGIAGT
ncbi:hypothetical protein A2U01_0046900 [Trifolium medium]|uniref:Uncharacterized protein n=1 Tax=Trifolium medium TaxID=97028 RepID=A0A392QP35_9FABA|nr:hypothetical protein [Trifolium medium]